MSITTIENTKAILKTLPKNAKNIELIVEGKAFKLPVEVYKNLLEILSEFGKGNTIEIVSQRFELTTQQAADFLHVSRPFLIKLLEEDKAIPFRKVGSHRRIRFSDLAAYRKKDDLEREQALDELQNLSQEMGFY